MQARVTSGYVSCHGQYQLQSRAGRAMQAEAGPAQSLHGQLTCSGFGLIHKRKDMGVFIEM